MLHVKFTAFIYISNKNLITFSYYHVISVTLAKAVAEPVGNFAIYEVCLFSWNQVQLNKVRCSER